MKVVYVAGALFAENNWEIQRNIHKAAAVGLEVALAGASPVIPHTNTGAVFIGTKTPEFWYAATLALLLKCDALVTVDNWRDSRGAVAEVLAAEVHGIPVFHSLDALGSWLRLLDAHEAGCGCPECVAEPSAEAEAFAAGPEEGEGA